MRRVAATYEWAGEDALLSHCTSGVLLELDGITSRRVEISTPRKLRSNLVIVHRRPTERLPSKRLGSVRVTSAEQTLLDLAGCVPEARLELAFDSALRNGSTRFDRVAQHLNDFGGRGVAGSRALGELLRQRIPCPRPTDSQLEIDFLRLTRRFGLPRVHSQFPVELSNGEKIHIDFAYPSQMLAIEVDSVRWHSGLRAIKRDNERQNLLVAMGWRVLRFEWNDVIYRPQVVAAQIRSALLQQHRVLDLG